MARRKASAPLAPTLTTKIAGKLHGVDRALIAPTAEVGHYLARTIRARVTKEHQWLHGRATSYKPLRGPADPNRRVWVPAAAWHPGTEGQHYKVIRTGPRAGWAIYADMGVYQAAVASAGRGRSIDFVQTGELWYRTLRVWVKSLKLATVHFSGQHRGATKRGRKRMYARDLARIHTRRHPGSALSVTLEEMTQVRRIVRKRVSRQVADAVAGKLRADAAMSRFKRANTRLSKLLGD